MSQKTPILTDQQKHLIESKSMIGPTIIIAGTVSGKENIHIDGEVEGLIDFRTNDVIVGEAGKIKANIIAKNITILGEVKGELRATTQVTIKPSGRLNGDIRAPRVVLNDGCQFKGSVDMDEKSNTLPPSELRSSRPSLSDGKTPYRSLSKDRK